MSLEPAFAMLMGLLILHQVPAALGVVGIVAVVIAGVGAARSGDRHASHVAADLARGG
jgi:inner membrane transporter RhtA